jgi:hypothetical protein
MEVISYNNIEYICVDYVYNNAPIYSKTCKNGRDLIKKKDIKDFIYLRLKDNVWVVSNGKSMKYDKIFIKKDFINSIPELNNLDKITDDNGIEAAPYLLELKDNEKFKDIDGKPLNIEVRGDRKSDKCFFKVKDVSDAFDMPNLYRVLISEDKSYQYNIDYKYFNCSKLTNSEKKTTKKELFLTYQGILRVLFVSRNNKTSPFVKWATETLFTVQMGNEDDKDNLASSLLGTTYKVVKQVFKSSSKTTPCIYLLIVKEEEDKLICKYGFTKDLVRRLSEHKSLFIKEFGKEPKLLYYGVIDIIYMSEAESNLSMYFKKYKYNYKTFDELIIIDKTELANIKMIYESMENKYIGRYEEMKNKINELKLEIIERDNKLKTIETQHSNELKTIETQHRHELELLKDKNKNELELLKDKNNLEIYKKEAELKLLLQEKDIEFLKREAELKLLIQQKDNFILQKELELMKKYKIK